MTVRLRQIELYRVRLPLIHEFETSSHRKGEIEHILVRVQSSDGVEGWGECASPSDPYYCEETTDTCWLMLGRYMAPALLGRDWRDPADAHAATAAVRGNRFARAGLDVACWDLWARTQELPLAEVIGGTMQSVPAGVSLGVEPTVDALLAQVALHAAQGYERVKLKIRPGWDVEPARAVRREFPRLALQVDANCAYRRDERALAVFAELDTLGLLMIEQPFGAHELLDHAALQRSLTTPICLDESIVELGDARAALSLQACRIINVKVSRLGGITPVLALHEFCRERDVALWCGGMHEFGVGRAGNVAVASLPGFTLPSDVSGSDKYFARDLVDPPVLAQGGRVPVPRRAPGLGHEVNIDMIEENLVDKRTISAADEPAP